MSSESIDLENRRDRALLHAVADQRCEILQGWQPVLFIDGRLCSDADAGRRLISAGFLAQPGLGTGRWPARLTKAGEAELAKADQADRVAGRH